jgi:galactose mutarotase-like enzyme
MAGKSLRHRGEELLDGDGIPLLYPWANRLAAFEYSALGKRVTLERGSPLIQLDDNGLPIHGLLFRWPDWQVEEGSTSSPPGSTSARTPSSCASSRFLTSCGSWRASTARGSRSARR